MYLCKEHQSELLMSMVRNSGVYVHRAFTGVQCSLTKLAADIE